MIQNFCFFFFPLKHFHTLTMNALVIRSKVKLTYHTYVLGSIGLQNLYSVPQNTQPQLIYGQLVVYLLSFFWAGLVFFPLFLEIDFSDSSQQWFGSLAYLCLTDCWFKTFLQPLFPGENAVDQLVEIIKVHFAYWWLNWCNSCKESTSNILSCRFLAPRPGKKFAVWTQIIQILGFHR